MEEMSAAIARKQLRNVEWPCEGEGGNSEMVSHGERWLWESDSVGSRRRLTLGASVSSSHD